MQTIREKLIELISGSGILCEICGENTLSYCAEALADHLLTNGVTFATDINDGSKWISVEDRKPVEEWKKITSESDAEIFPCLCCRWDNHRICDKALL